MKVTQAELDYYIEEEAGYCRVCNEFTVEGEIGFDADFLTCPSCLLPTLMGPYFAIVSQRVLVVNEH